MGKHLNHAGAERASITLQGSRPRPHQSATQAHFVAVCMQTQPSGSCSCNRWSAVRCHQPCTGRPLQQQQRSCNTWHSVSDFAASQTVQHDPAGDGGMAPPAQPTCGVSSCCHTLSQAGNAPCWSRTSLCTVRGLLCSTVQPTETQVPSISLTVPDRFLEQLRSLMIRAISITSSKDKLPLCLMFFSCRKGGLEFRNTCREQA